MLALKKFDGKKFKKKFETSIDTLSNQELKELLMINTYKLALVRSQLEAMTSILIKKKLATYEEIWEKTNNNFKETTM